MNPNQESTLETNAKKAAALCEANFEKHVEDLKALVRIPSVSFEGFDPNEVKRSAQAVFDLLKKSGFEKVQIIEFPGAHPYVYGERLKAPGAPTLLLYAHHDVQPPGREELWKTSPFEPTLKEGPGGMRLYGRGTADDKAGVIFHTASVSSWLEAAGELPVNVKVVIEGEEEAGSSHLADFIAKYRPMLDADVLVLTDTGNFECGIPALTVALRGLVGLEIEVRALNKTVHSGMWGGPLPDPAMALTKMLSGLVGEDGRIAIPGVLDKVRGVTADEKADIMRIPVDEKEFREQSGIIDSAPLLKEGPHLIAQLWKYPSLVVNAIQASSRHQAGNIINDTAWAKVTIRLVPDMNPEDVMKRLQDFIKSRAPWGVEVKFKVEACNGPWSISPKGPAYDAAVEAMKKGYGVAPYFLGSGGSIPFVQPFADALGGVPAILVGVEDPYTNAHGENESLLMSDFKKGLISQVHLFSEIAKKL